MNKIIERLIRTAKRFGGSHVKTDFSVQAIWRDELGVYTHTLFFADAEHAQYFFMIVAGMAEIDESNCYGFQLPPDFKAPIKRVTIQTNAVKLAEIDADLKALYEYITQSEKTCDTVNHYTPTPAPCDCKKTRASVDRLLIRRAKLAPVNGKAITIQPHRPVRVVKRQAQAVTA